MTHRIALPCRWVWRLVAAWLVFASGPSLSDSFSWPLSSVDWPANVARAQVRIPDEALPNELEMRRLLDQGRRLEEEQRWGEALTYYENAIRDYPQLHDLQGRLARARVHYDLARRYQDATFTASLRTLDEKAALDVYLDVLRKIQTHYVRPPDWNQLVRQGVLHLEIALSQNAFRRENSLRQSEDEIDAFRTALYRRLDGVTVDNFYQARDVAAMFGRLAEQQLGLRSQAVILEFTCGAASALDPYSCYLSRGQLEDVFAQIEGNFVGLGIEIKGQNQALVIVNVIRGSPAEQAGMQRGDLIIEIDGVATRDVPADAAADLLRGPEGSMVLVTVVRGNNPPTRLRMYRRRVDVPSIENAAILDADSGIAYMRLTSFQKTTARDVDDALRRLHSQGMQRLIIDLRGNPGGLLSASVDVADRFLANGAIVSTRGRNSQEDADYKAHREPTWRMPLIVLIDGDTASASEIFAGAIHDHRRGTVIGQRSYGKGSVQGIFSLDQGRGGIRLTTAKFYSPSGQAISNQGVQPDVIVHSVKKTAAASDESASTRDEVLDAALEYARVRLTSR